MQVYLLKGFVQNPFMLPIGGCFESLSFLVKLSDLLRGECPDRADVLMCRFRAKTVADRTKLSTIVIKTHLLCAVEALVAETQTVSGVFQLRNPPFIRNPPLKSTDLFKGGGGFL